jgi:putative peptide zinc metalloprotease protein
VVLSAVVLGIEHWDDLTTNVVDRVLATQNLVLLWFVYPLVKLLHEFGHGYAVKTWGGEVHEMGIMFLVFMPVPYVDASAASEYRSKYRRVVVGSGGILVELFVSSLALFAWLALEPGLARTLAFNVVLIGSVSTLLFNGNPLLRFDGYYILADLLEIQNLGQRSTQYLGWTFRRRVLGSTSESEPYVGPGERGWLLSYAVAAFVYRMFVYVGIVLFVAGKFFFIGVILALWAAFNMVVTPVSKAVRFVVSSPVLRESRGRAVGTTVALIAVGLAVLFLLPLPLRTRAEGVVWVPERALVRTGTEGFIDRIVADPGVRVEAGDRLVACTDPLLEAETRVLEAKLDELDSRYTAAMAYDRVQSQIVDRERTHVRARLARARERREELEVRSAIPGTFVVPDAEDLPGRYVPKGALLGYVLDVDRPTVRVVVPQSRIDLVRRRMRAVEVRFAEDVARVVPARVRREVPEAEQQLPSTILGSRAGGAIATDPFEEGGTRAFERVFQFDLEVDEAIERVLIGGRVHVRFDHGAEPAAFQAYRKIRQMFLRRFNV